MKCPQCGYECPPDFDFCPKCAAPVQVRCPECGFRAPAAFAFCPMCATALTAAAEEPSLPALDEAIQRLVPREFAERLLATRGQVGKERRVVTTLFSDVKGSTAMAESLDAEDVMEITDGAFGVLIEPIYRYEGTLARLMGDAVLAFFGTPIAHEDDQNCTVMPRLAPNLKCTPRYAGLTDDPNYDVIRLENSSNSEARRAI